MDVFVAFFSRYMMRGEVNGDLNEEGGWLFRRKLDEEKKIDLGPNRRQPIPELRENQKRRYDN